MAPRIVPGPASQRLAAMIGHHLDDEPVPCTVDRFPDGELRPELARGRVEHVYVVQSTGPPVNDRLVELLLLLDACRRARAGRITAVVPYFGYARQDRRSRPGQAIGARAVADTLTATGANRLLVVDPHAPALEAMFAIPVELLTAIPVLVPALADLPSDTVVVAPDLGAPGLAERVAARLDRPVAVVRKTRITGSTVHADELIGNVADRPILIVDDMISTGATIEAAARMALARGAAPHMTAVATHGLLVGDATERLHALPLHRLVVTDTTSLPTGPSSWVDVRSVDVLLVRPDSGPGAPLFHAPPAAIDVLGYLGVDCVTMTSRPPDGGRLARPDEDVRASRGGRCPVGRRRYERTRRMGAVAAHPGRVDGGGAARHRPRFGRRWAR